MPIIEVRGDITKSGAKVIFHCANCFHTMGKGVAKALRDRWPEVYEADKETKRGDRSKLGDFSIATPDDGPDFIFNLYGQYSYGNEKRHLDYLALSSALVKMKEILDAVNPKKDWKIATNRIGCSNAGGDWTIVKAMLEEIFPDRAIHIYSK